MVRKKTLIAGPYIFTSHIITINSMGPPGAIRTGKYKLIEVFETGEVELYDLENDMGEKHGPLLKLCWQKILSQLHEWQKKSGVDMPTLNTGYLPEKDIRTKH